jgi:hypothetical protein
MFDWFFYIVAAVLAAPVVAVIALVRSVQLNKRLHGIELKLAMLERQSAPAVSSATPGSSTAASGSAGSRLSNCAGSANLTGPTAILSAARVVPGLGPEFSPSECLAGGPHGQLRRALRHALGRLDRWRRTRSRRRIPGALFNSTGSHRTRCSDSAGKFACARADLCWRVAAAQ